ncbi:MAG TPA: UTP--glucose-1-phosphate uridylyltransferase, partial [Chloroflexota bacterium]|nr:UTP--glucose-1-phosphate uridylyltransferase [Chloroflexota bacterium]
FGMHVLTPSIMALLAELESRSPVQLSSALQALAAREKYLAYELPARRFDVGVKYGLLTAQLALALAGSDREEVLARVLDVLAQRELAR